jgi:DNA-binding transcriptional LysR family regulator
MDLRQLRYFLAIAEEGSITAAAAKLNMAQPPLSQQLRQLEEELGVKLVERGPRKSELTDSGRMLASRASQILDLARSAEREILDHREGLAGSLSLGMVSSSGLPDANVAAFHARYPGVAFDIHEGNTYELLELLGKGVIEVAVVRTPFNATNLDCRYAATEPMMAIWPGEDPFPGKPKLELRDLAGRPLVLYRRFERIFLEECEKAGFEPRLMCRNEDARTTASWVRGGYGIGIVPRSALTQAGAGLAGKEIADEALRTRLTAVRLKGSYASLPAQRFFEDFNKAAVKE